MSVLYDLLKAVETNVNRLNNRIRELEQENEDLKGQLQQFGIDYQASKGFKRGLFLH